MKCLPSGKNRAPNARFAIESRNTGRGPSLPSAAYLFYRRGTETLRSGATEDGVRMLRGATQLDPTFLAPRLALLSHFSIDPLKPRDVHRAIHQVVPGERRVFTDARGPFFANTRLHCPLPVLRVSVQPPDCIC